MNSRPIPIVSIPNRQPFHFDPCRQLRQLLIRLIYFCLMSFLLRRGGVFVSALYQSIPYGVVVCTHGGVTSLVLSSHALFTGMNIVDVSGGVAASGWA